jgi:hypothetical protein
MTNAAARHTALPQADAPVFWDPKRVGPFVWCSIYNLKVVRWRAMATPSGPWTLHPSRNQTTRILCDCALGARGGDIRMNIGSGSTVTPFAAAARLPSFAARASPSSRAAALEPARPA